MEVKKVFVVGAGLMGNGIAQVSAVAGYQVIMSDVDNIFLDRALATIDKSLDRFIKKGAITTEQKGGALARIQVTTDINRAAEADLVIEVVPENLELKLEVFKKLDQLCRPEVVIASNTSAIPISKLAAATNRPSRVVGTHFFSPVPMMRLVELVCGLSTSEETLNLVKEFTLKIGKDFVVCRMDCAGFLLNRIGMPWVMEAIRCVQDGVATAEDIDKGYRLGYNYPMGPLELIDMTGIDTTYQAALAIYQDTGDPKFYPPSLMHRMVEAGHVGRKAGRGFYDYTKK
ncbi:MAG: 3-hydroxybutyryl-CoA dehydrogenase [Firmicutes bacterium]|nr:3-hydroxybutyryl-CoA dehydrogenase [Bacillota bacterium]